MNLIIKDDRHLHISKFVEQTFLPRQGLREEAPTGYLINWILYIKRLMFRWQFYVMGFFRKFRKTFDMVLTIYKNIYNSLTVIFPFYIHININKRKLYKKNTPKVFSNCEMANILANMLDCRLLN